MKIRNDLRRQNTATRWLSPDNSARLAVLKTQETRYAWGILYLGAGASMVANGFFMLFWPALWFEVFPGKLSEFGSYNRFLICEISSFYTMIGVLCLVAVRQKQWHPYAGILLAAFYLSQLYLQIVEILCGNIEFEHLLIYLPPVHLPVVVSLTATLIFARKAAVTV